MFWVKHQLAAGRMREKEFASYSLFGIIETIKSAAPSFSSAKCIKVN